MNELLSRPWRLNTDTGLLFVTNGNEDYSRRPEMVPYTPTEAEVLVGRRIADAPAVVPQEDPVPVPQAPVESEILEDDFKPIEEPAAPEPGEDEPGPVVVAKRGRPRKLVDSDLA